MNKIRLYVGPWYKEEKLYTYVELLFPFWGVVAKESMPYVRAAELQYQYSKNDFELVEDIADADFVLVPYSYDRLKQVNPKKLQNIIEEATAAGKLLLIDGAGDLETPIDIPNAVILRVSQYAYSKRKNEITIPFPAEDLLETYCAGELQLRQKPVKPVVGFTGWADVPFKKRLKIFYKEFPIYIAEIFTPKRGAEHKGILYRARVLKILSKDSRIDSNFTARKTYSGHTKTIIGSVADNRKEFVENLLSSDYALCIKGDANSSVRFYEALSLGRIPLLLDTACVLPLETKVRYREFCIYVDWKDIDNITEKLLEAHNELSPETFIDMQRKARQAYKEHLRFDAFSNELAAILRTFIKV
jgi:glycosyltransferase involved in cell wall biosynthesis